MQEFSFTEAVRLGRAGFRMRRATWPLDNWLGIAYGPRKNSVGCYLRTRNWTDPEAVPLAETDKASFDWVVTARPPGWNVDPRKALEVL